VAEWCGSVYQPYPLKAKGPAEGERVVRGGSWDDRPRRVRSAFRQSYAPDYCVYNVGFRVVCDIAE
jgi:formylglycine-generating enzyme required for sulfatase activity